jgi:hypothetical protein
MQSDLLGFREAEREYGIPRAYLRELEVVATKGKAKFVRRQDVEDLIARTGRCEGCGELLKVGRSWHQRCLAHKTNGEIWTDDLRKKHGRAQKARWAQESSVEARAAFGAATAERMSLARQRFLQRKGDEGLLDAQDVAGRANIAEKYVLELARERDLGVLIDGGNGKQRRLFTPDEYEILYEVVHNAERTTKAHKDWWEEQRQRISEESAAIDVHGLAREIDVSVEVVRRSARAISVGRLMTLGEESSRLHTLWFTAEEAVQIADEIQNNTTATFWSSAVKGQPVTPTYASDTVPGNEVKSDRHWREERTRREAYAKERGLLTLDEVAKKVGRERATTARWASKLGVGAKIGVGQQTLLFTPKQVTQIKAAIKSSKSPAMSVYESPETFAAWYKARYNGESPSEEKLQEIRQRASERQGGRKGGKRSSGGGRKSTLTQDQALEIERERARGRINQQQIAVRLGVSRDVVRYYLKKHPETA